VQEGPAGVGYEETFPEQIDEGGKKVAAMFPRTEQRSNSLMEKSSSVTSPPH